MSEQGSEQQPNDPRPSEARSNEPRSPDPPAAPAEVTRLLLRLRDGDRQAFDLLVPLVYDDLRRIARRQLRGSSPTRSLDTTSLVHEVYLKMVDQARVPWNDRVHFFAVSARAMRQVIVTYARRRNAAKRGGGVRPVTLDERDLAVDEQAEQLLALDQALGRLADLDPRLPQVVECRFFAGMSEEETAAALDVSVRTVQRDWKRARAWLKEALRAGTRGETGAGAEVGPTAGGSGG